MPVERITPRVARVGGDTWNGTVRALSAAGDANVYLIAAHGTSALVDCGTVAGLELVDRNLRDAGADPTRIADLLLTHSHHDHTHAAHRRQVQGRVRTHLNAVGAEYLERDDHRLVGHQMHGPGYTFEPFHVDHAVEDGEDFEAAGVRFTAYHLPGHTPDSTLFCGDLDGMTVGICGDIAFGPTRDGTPALGLLSSLWLSDLDAYAESLRRLEAMRLDALLPGHGGHLVGRDTVQQAIRATHAVAERLARDSDVRTSIGA